MQSKAQSVKQGKSNLYNVATSTVYSDLWWSNTGSNSISPVMIRGSVSDSSSLEQSADGNSQSEGGTGINEEDGTNKRSRSMTPLQPDKTDKLENMNLHQVPLASHPTDNGNINQGPQLELVGHSVACGSNPYESYYGGMFAAYGQPLIPLALHPY